MNAINWFEIPVANFEQVERKLDAKHSATRDRSIIFADDDRCLGG